MHHGNRLLPRQVPMPRQPKPDRMGVALNNNEFVRKLLVARHVLLDDWRN